MLGIKLINMKHLKNINWDYVIFTLSCIILLSSRIKIKFLNLGAFVIILYLLVFNNIITGKPHESGNFVMRLIQIIFIFVLSFFLLKKM